MTELEAFLDALSDRREKLLSIAAADVRKWCTPSSQMVGNKRPDTYWMELLEKQTDISVQIEQAHQFLTSFQLTNRVEWDKAAVAALMKQTGQSVDLNALRDVPQLASSLRMCNKRQTRQTSAASKIMTFAKPKAKVFIWDDLVTKSARWRDWLRKGKKGRARLSVTFVDENGEHDYEAYFNACDRAYEDERSRADFLDEASKLDNYFMNSTGIMADRDRAPTEFVRRRLLDKLMFWEGRSIKDEQLPA